MINIKRVGAVVALAVVVAGGASAAFATGGTTAVGADGFTKVTQTRVFDSRTQPGGIALLSSGHSQRIDPNAITKGLVPAGATAVEIQITAAQETEVSGDLIVTPTQIGSPVATSNLNYTKGVSITSSTVAPLSGGTFYVYNHGGTAGNLRLIVDILGYYAPTAVYTPPSTVTKTLPGVASVPTGGSFNSRAVDAGTIDLPAGTYMVTLSTKSTPLVQSNTAVQVFPSVHLYSQVKNAAFTGDVLDTGGSALESGTITNADLFSSNSGLVTLSADTTLHAYAFGYDSDSGEGTYKLDSVTITATPVNPGS